MEGATQWLKNLADFCCSPQQQVPQPQSTEFSRNYVPLNASAQEPVSPKAPEASVSEETSPDASEASGFTPLSSQTADLGGEDTETAADVEEFFDEEDPEDEEPPMPKED